MSGLYKRVEDGRWYASDMDTNLQGRVALIVGATSGMGRATALAFARERAKVAVTFHRDAAGAEETAQAVRDAGSGALVVRHALEKPEAARSLVTAVTEHFGALHVLVNNAVSWPRGFATIADVDIDDFAACMTTNVVGTMAVIQAAIPAMRRAGFGRIVTVSTGLVVDGLPGAGPYAASKGALHALHRTLAKELGPDGILCNVLMSGTVDNQRPRPDWLRDSLAACAATGRMTDAEDIARMALYLGSEANGHVHGEAIRVDGLFVAPLAMPSPPTDETEGTR